MLWSFWKFNSVNLPKFLTFTELERSLSYTHPIKGDFKNQIKTILSSRGILTLTWKHCHWHYDDKFLRNLPRHPPEETSLSVHIHGCGGSKILYRRKSETDISKTRLEINQCEKHLNLIKIRIFIQKKNFSPNFSFTLFEVLMKLSTSRRPSHNESSMVKKKKSFSSWLFSLTQKVQSREVVLCDFNKVWRWWGKNRKYWTGSSQVPPIQDLEQLKRNDLVNFGEWVLYCMTITRKTQILWSLWQRVIPSLFVGVSKARIQGGARGGFAPLASLFAPSWNITK